MARNADALTLAVPCFDHPPSCPAFILTRHAADGEPLASTNGDPPARPRSQRSPRVHAAGVSPSPYERPRRDRKEPPRSRGGSLTITLGTARPRSRSQKKRNSTDGKAGALMSSDPFCTGNDAGVVSAAAWVNGESRSYPCSGFAIRASPGSPRVHAAVNPASLESGPLPRRCAGSRRCLASSRRRQVSCTRPRHPLGRTAHPRRSSRWDRGARSVESSPHRHSALDHHRERQRATATRPVLEKPGLPEPAAIRSQRFPAKWRDRTGCQREAGKRMPSHGVPVLAGESVRKPCASSARLCFGTPWTRTDRVNA